MFLLLERYASTKRNIARKLEALITGKEYCGMEMGKKLVKIAIIFVVLCVIVLASVKVFKLKKGGGIVVAPENVPEFSDKYLVGIDIGGVGGFGTYYDTLSANVIVCTDHTIIVQMPTAESAAARTLVYEDVKTITLTDQQYANIESSVNRAKLYTMDVRENNNVDDGSSYYLTLYGKDDSPCKNCGGYMPENGAFWSMYDSVTSNLPIDEILNIRQEYIDIYNNL